MLDRRVFTLSAAAALVTAPAALGALAPPAGPTLLQLAGPGVATNLDGVAAFDAAMLQALPQTDYVTSTPWSNGRVAYRGPRMTDVLAAAGATGEGVRLTAINDYSLEATMALIAEHQPILAMSADGVALTRRTKGPLFVMFDLDALPAATATNLFAYCVWQLVRIDVA